MFKVLLHLTLAFNLVTKVIRLLSVYFLGKYSHLYLRALGCEVGKNVKLGCPPLVFLNRFSRIKIGNNVKLASCSLQNQICKDRLILSTQAPGAEIIIGDGSGVSCSILYAVNSIRIGKNVNIGANCRIFDTDFHPVDIDARRFHNKLEIINSPVIIEDDVWLAGNVTILKGVRIGRGTIIGFGSIVTCDIPAGVLAVGTPAKVIKNIVK